MNCSLTINKRINDSKSVEKTKSLDDPEQIHNSNKKPMDKEMKEKSFWTKYEDDLLLGFIKQSQNKNWRLISEYVKTKSPQQCAYRYGKLMSDMSRKKWNRKDDIKLIELVENFGQNWDLISKEFGDRSERDVESRYKDKLDPNVKNTKFTEDEDLLLKKLYEEFGNDWFHIARYFKNRNAKMIKKRFLTNLKFDCKAVKRRRSVYIHEVSTCSHSQSTTPKGPVTSEVNSQHSSSDDQNSSFESNNVFHINMLPDRNDLIGLEILNANHLKIDLCASFSSQMKKLDNYYCQITKFYKQKSVELDSILAFSNGLGLEINNILNINAQVSTTVEGLMDQIHRLHKERENLSTEESYKVHTVSYIENVLQLIQQIRLKINMLWTLTKRGARI